MNSRRLIPLLIVSMLAGCGPSQMPARAQEKSSIYKTQTFTIQAEPDPVGDPGKCDEMQGEATCVIKVVVTVSDNMCSVTMNDYFAAGPRPPVNRIEWRLPTGFKFCTRNGDGVFFASAPNPPFDPDASGPCKDSYALNRNSAHDNLNYGYFLRFRNDLGTLQCVKDPFFKNG